MLASSPVTTILPVIDLKRARDFYENKLGLKPVGAKPDGKFVYACGGALIALFPRGSATKADHTALSFEVKDIVKSIADFKKNGVVFNDYDIPGLKTVNPCLRAGRRESRLVQRPGRQHLVYP